jgi:hypothetical protein
MKYVGIAAIAVVLAVVAFRFLGGREDEAKSELPAVCVACGEEAKTLVGATPGLEEWPRECPKCHKRQLYLGDRCGRCNRLIPQKDPKGEGFGQPEACPHCKNSSRGT